MSFASEAIPFTRVGNRRCLTGLQLAENPWLQQFVAKFPNSFEAGVNIDALFFIEPELAPA